ncbi:hypothetical protein ACFQ2O_22070, partial [Pontibacter rugosus]
MDSNKLGLNEFITKEQECQMYLHQAQILTRHYEFDLVLSLTHKVLSISLNYDFVNFTVEALELKISCYSELGNLREFNATVAQLRNWNEKQALERNSLIIYQTVKVYLKQTVRKRQHYLQSLPNMIQQLKDTWEKCLTFTSFDAYYKVSIYYYELVGEFDAIISMTKQSQLWFEDNKANVYRFDQLYNKFILVYAHFRSKLLAEGLMYASKYVSDFSKSSYNWFSY